MGNGDVDGAPVPEFDEPGHNEEGDSDEEYEPYKILNERGQPPKLEYFVHWKGYAESEATWEPDSHIASCTSVIRAWEDSASERLKTNKKRKAATKAPSKKTRRKR
jgi:chromobox protein 5